MVQEKHESKLVNYAAVALGTLSFALSAQTQLPRREKAINNRVTVYDATGTDALETWDFKRLPTTINGVPQQVPLKWAWGEDGGSATGTGEFSNSPFLVPGVIRNLYDGRILFPGYEPSTDTGYIQLLKLDSAQNAVTEEELLTLPGVDPFMVAYNTEELALYIWNHNGSTGPSLLRATWLGGEHGSSFSLPGAGDFQTILTSAEVPQLDGAIFHSLVARFEQGGVALVPTFEPMGSQAYPRIHIYQVGAAWVHEEGSWYDPNYAEDHGIACDNTLYPSIFGPFNLKGPGIQYNLRDVTAGTVVTNGQLPTVIDWWLTDDSDLLTWHTVPGPLLLEPGHEYIFESVNGAYPPSVPLFPIIRFGNPVTDLPGPDGNRYYISPGDVDESNFYPDGFVVVDADLVSLNKIDNEPFTQYFLLFVGDESLITNPPLIDLGNGHYQLDTPLMFGPEPFVMDQMTMSSEGPVFATSIPDDDNLIGTVALCQWVVGHPASGNLLFSDVFGTKVLPRPVEEGAAALALPPAQLTLKESQVNQLQKDARKNWVDTLKTEHAKTLMKPHERAVIRKAMLNGALKTSKK